MVRRALIVVAIAGAIALFLVANRGAYEGFFSDDDIDNLAWTTVTPASSFLWGLVAPKYYPQHFRPVGHGTFHILGRFAGIDFKRYVTLVHILHFVNALLVFLLLRRLKAPPWTAIAGALLFLFPMQVFDALWKPMYLFDVWCALFSLACLLFWMDRRFVLAFACFWLAFKSKEHAVMLPFVLAAYEYWLGERKWKPLLPFAALAGLFAAQGFLFNKQQGDEYRIHLSPWLVVKTSSFYLSRIMLYPWLGVALLALPRLTRDRRVYFTLAAAGMLLLPMLILPERLYAAYLYVSVAFVLAAVTLAMSRLHWAVTAAFVLLWLPLNFLSLRTQRKAALTYAQENQAYVTQVFEMATSLPDVRRFVVDGTPEQFRWWGVQGALRWAYRTFDLELIRVDDKNLSEVFAAGPVAMLSWEPPARKLIVTARKPEEPDASYLTLTRYMPVWQLEQGWYQAEHRYRWTAPKASARLWRPAGARRFRFEANIGPQYIEMVKKVRVRVLLDGSPVGDTVFDAHGWKVTDFPIAAANAGTVHVTFEVEPPLQPNPEEPRLLGIPIGGFGFLP